MRAAIATMALALTFVGCGIEPPNGYLLCSTSGKACPDGYECAQAHCWKRGTSPLAGGDMAGSQPTDDLGPPLKQLGEACTTGAECSTAVCADNVCCNRACGGQCEACSADGKCNPVAGTPHLATRVLRGYRCVPRQLRWHQGDVLVSAVGDHLRRGLRWQM